MRADHECTAHVRQGPRLSFPIPVSAVSQTEFIHAGYGPLRWSERGAPVRA